MGIAPQQRRKIEVPKIVEVPSLGAIFLAEFAPGPDVRVMSEFEMPELDAPRMQAAGKRLHRVISQEGRVVAAYDENLKMTPLDFMAGLGDVVFAVATPGNPSYFWRLMGAQEPGDGNSVFMVTGVRDASPAEAAHLDRAFPGWLGACFRFDRLEEGARLAAELRSRVGVPPPRGGLLDRENEDEPPVG